MLLRIDCTASQSSRAGKPSARSAASMAMISASELECDTAPCFLHIQVMGTKVASPNRQRKAPVVDLLSLSSAANDASQKSPN